MEISSSPCPEKCALKADRAFLKRSASVALDRFFMAHVHIMVVFINSEHSNIMNTCQGIYFQFVLLKPV